MPLGEMLRASPAH